MKTLVVVTEFTSLMDRKCGLKTPRAAACTVLGPVAGCVSGRIDHVPGSLPPAPEALRLQTKQIHGTGFACVVSTENRSGGTLALWLRP
jgi:hypothetical protein